MVNCITNAILVLGTFFLLSKLPCCKGIKGYLDVEKLLAERPKAAKMPHHELESLARCFIPAITAFFESDKGKAEFSEWKEEQNLTNSGNAPKRKVG